jgi:hypothetical protein
MDVLSGSSSGTPAQSALGAADTAYRSFRQEYHPGAEYAIHETPLADGAIRLSLDVAGKRVRPTTGRPARVITMAWGDQYIDSLLTVAIPALLSPNNFPAFIEHFDCEFVIVTEVRAFDRIAATPAIAALLHHCDVRLVPVDDLISPWYGLALTYALMRGFSDLGPRMVETHLVFLNADFVVADGSYRSLAEHILRGERLIVSPSYCVNLEEAIVHLRARYNEKTCSLAVTRRDMAALILAHRHNCIRAKTVNQPLFNIGLFDQFYWYVDRNTLIGRQMPIAVVYMRPERALTELATFWDYGMVSELCPNLTPCVLGDSDDFVMAELRTSSTFRERHRIGRPPPKEMAAHLSTHITKDHRDYGRYSLVLHSQDLPDTVAAGEQQLARFVDEVYRYLSPPLNHLGHPFWTQAYPPFIASRHARKQLMDRAIETRAETKRTLRDNPDFAARRSQINRLRQREQELERELARAHFAAPETLQFRPDMSQNFQPIAATGFAGMRLQTELNNVARNLSLLIAEERDDIVPTAGAGLVPGLDPAPSPLRLVASPRSILGKAYRAAFGVLPKVKKWHPYYTILRHANAAIADLPMTVRALLIASPDAQIGALVAGQFPDTRIIRAPSDLLSPLNMRFHERDFRERGPLNLCICDLNAEDLLRFRAIAAVLKPHLAHGARVVVIHRTAGEFDFDRRTFDLTKQVFPIDGASKITFGGSFAGALATRWFARAVRKYRNTPLSALMVLAPTLAITSPVARLAAWLEDRNDAAVPPGVCTNFVITLDDV